ncbi:MAG TPA: hypothetical protein VIM29_00360 [Bacillota bacterium]
MKILIRVLIVTVMIITLGTAVLAEGFQMDRVTVGVKRIEDEEDQNWLYFNSNTTYDWMRMNLQGKFYFPQLSENWVDYSRNGMGDLYSGVKANFRFPQLSKGLDASLGYKWNENYDISLYGLGYGWSPVRHLTLGARYDIANRKDKADGSKTSSNTPDPETGGASSEEDYGGDLDRQQAEFYLDYSPRNWGYSLNVKRIDRDFVNASQQMHDNFGYNRDYSSLSYETNQRLTWQATSKLLLGLRYATTDAEYEDQLKRDGDKERWVLSGTYKLNNNWTLSSSYSQTDYTGFDGGYNTDSISARAKYTSDSNWWLAAKLFLNDYYYDVTYQAHYNNPKDKDADYNSRQQQVVAVEFEQKLEPFSYNLEVFVKNFQYDAGEEPEDDTKAGIIGVIAWDWMNLHWSFRAAPNGDLYTRKANYELKATYKF